MTLSWRPQFIGGAAPAVPEFLRLTVERAQWGVLALNEAGRIVAANDRAAGIFGYAAGELSGRPLADLIPELSDAGAVNRWSAATSPAGTADQDQIVTGVRKDGAPVSLEASNSVATAGSSQFLLVSITEPLDLKSRLTAANESELSLQRLVADVALKLARTESLAMDDLINDSLRQLGEALQIDRAMLWRKGADDSSLAATHYWIKASCPSPPPSLAIDSIPFVLSKLEAGEVTWFSRVDEVPDPVDRETLGGLGLMSGVVVPLSLLGEQPGTLSALAFDSMSAECDWVSGIIEHLQLIAGSMGQALARRASEASLATALGELDRLRDRLADEPAAVRREVRTTKTSRLIVAESTAVKYALAQIEQVAATSATVLLQGETGTGKEVYAQAIHDTSPRHQRSMVVVSCAAIPTALIESELFGRERGAYTGALSRQIGRFEAANLSTLFLDEIGELPMEMQVKLLRVLQERTIERLGSTHPIKVDVRIIAATNRDLEAAVRDGTFREDLYYRLNVFPIVVPPLRERVEDIPSLVWAFVDEFSRAFGKAIDSIPSSNLQELKSYSWPGNVRELRNLIERAVILSTGRQLVVPVPRRSARVPHTAMTLEALEIEHIRRVLETTNWRVRGAGGAAERLGLKPTTLESRMARLGISRKQAC